MSWDAREAEPKDRRPIIAAAAIVAVLVLGAIAYVTLHRRPSAPPPKTIDAVAVLPFTNEDPNTQHLSDGLTEILIDRLSRLPDLRVMARTTVFVYKGKKIDPREAGEKLNVSGVVTGHLRHDGDRYQIHVELIDVKDGTQLWGYQFDATTATLSSVQSQISEELATVLRQGVTREQRRIVAARYTSNPEAYDAYLWGLYSWNKRRDRRKRGHE